MRNLLETQVSLSPLTPSLSSLLLILRPSLPLTTSSRDYITKFKFVGINRPFPLLCLPSPAHPTGFSLFLDWFPCHYYRSSPNNITPLRFAWLRFLPLDTTISCLSSDERQLTAQSSSFQFENKLYSIFVGDPNYDPFLLNNLWSISVSDPNTLSLIMIFFFLLIRK